MDLVIMKTIRDHNYSETYTQLHSVHRRLAKAIATFKSLLYEEGSNGDEDVWYALMLIEGDTQLNITSLLKKSRKKGS